MSPLSYPERHELLGALLDQLVPNPPPSSFRTNKSLSGDLNDRGVQLDCVLHRLWAAPVDRKGKQIERCDTILDDEIASIERFALGESDFDILGQLGQGQFGVSLSLAIERQVHAIASGSKDPVPSLLAAFQTRENVYLVIQYAPCGSLWDRISAEGSESGRLSPVESGELRWWAAQMASKLGRPTLVRADDLRDIKPHNFLVLPDRRLLLTDFGSAAELDPHIKYLPRHQCSVPVGTPDYIAPEILHMAEDALVHLATSCHSHNEPSARDEGYGADVDWWSLGATLFEMAIGLAPFWADSISETYELITNFKVRHSSPLER
ncbi:hypothetical protein JCM24511_07003 [Saitozyma sp. JCM 24511]|nr:hypothetical protein JCM24511_07003 [Saitozyma sp. JCM 24511]